MSGEPVQSSSDRIHGALIGLAVGDAVGTTVDFESAVLAALFGQLAGACYRVCITGSVALRIEVDADAADRSGNCRMSLRPADADYANQEKAEGYGVVGVGRGVTVPRSPTSASSTGASYRGALQCLTISKERIHL